MLLDENKIATGVELLTSSHGSSATERKERLLIEAGKEVILSAGSARSPQILLLSGIGPKEELQKHGVRALRDNIVQMSISGEFLKFTPVV